MIEYMFFFFKQKTAYEMRISDWSSDVCSSDLAHRAGAQEPQCRPRYIEGKPVPADRSGKPLRAQPQRPRRDAHAKGHGTAPAADRMVAASDHRPRPPSRASDRTDRRSAGTGRRLSDRLPQTRQDHLDNPHQGRTQPGEDNRI